MVTGRAVVGAAVGAASFVTPLFIAELAPAKYRGRLVTMNVLLITLGQVVAYVVGWVFAEYGEEDSGWRWMVGLGAVPAVVQGLLVVFMPETPRWLVMVRRSTEAREVVSAVAASSWTSAIAAGLKKGTTGGTARRQRNVKKVVDSVMRAIEEEVEEEDRTRRLRRRHGHENAKMLWLNMWEELLKVRGNRRALAVACLLQGLQQLCGFVSARPAFRFLPCITK